MRLLGLITTREASILEDRNKEIRASAVVANISEKIREAKFRWLEHVARKTEDDVVMRTWKSFDTER